MEDYILRAEFDRYCQMQNGALLRIERRQEAMDAKLDKIVECIHGRVERDEFYEEQNKAWRAINTLRRLVYIGLGLAIAVEVLVIPLIFLALKK